MSFDNETRNILSRTVNNCRKLLTEDVLYQMKSTYGLYPDGTELTMEQLSHLPPDQHDAACDIRELLNYYVASATGEEKRRSAFDRVVFEISFTCLNRLAALKMCEERGIVVECVRKGTSSDGFRLFEQVTVGVLGTTYNSYRIFLESIFDEMALDLGVLFDRFTPHSAIFPSERCLENILNELNNPELKDLWAEDETIGWIYQYFNPQEERKAMREASQAPRSSRELAVRNQFFTPRYVVEFLTDNTLGRTWYEMCQGKTNITNNCSYLVIRPDEVFLDKSNSSEVENAQSWLSGKYQPLPNLAAIANTVDGYKRIRPSIYESAEWLENKLCTLNVKEVESFKTQELLDILFLLQRCELFSEGAVEDYTTEIDLILNEVCKRVEKAKAEDLEQEELLKQPVFIPYRVKKDPRDIKIMDPACGSGHFLLYAFDLLETIYIEAWEDEHQPVSEVTGNSLKNDYDTLKDLQLHIPELVMHCNLFGIDIDHRAVQIASLALWLRAQKSWQKNGVKPNERPKISKTNIVTAEPMPGDDEMRKEFIDKLQPKVLGQIVNTVFEKMELAGEAGSLLKIEEEISDEIAKAKEQWLKRPQMEQQQFFKTPSELKQGKIHFKIDEITDEDFWEQAEGLILDAMKTYAESAESGDVYKRRLFLDDAAGGFAFIDLCRNKYDVVLMNPPFGDPTKRSKGMIIKVFPKTKNDVYAAFVERGLNILYKGGMLGAITSRTGFFLSSFTKWREEILLEIANPLVFADLGYGVMDAAMVEAAAYCLEATK